MVGHSVDEKLGVLIDRHQERMPGLFQSRLGQLSILLLLMLQVLTMIFQRGHLQGQVLLGFPFLQLLFFSFCQVICVFGQLTLQKVV